MEPLDEIVDGRIVRTHHMEDWSAGSIKVGGWPSNRIGGMVAIGAGPDHLVDALTAHPAVANHVWRSEPHTHWGARGRLAVTHPDVIEGK
jgi:hypothetical protein